MIIHDLRCEECEAVRHDVPCEFGSYGTCECGGAMKIAWDGGRAPGTDVYGQTYYNETFRCEVSSSGQVRKLAKERGWERCANQLQREGRIPVLEVRGRGRNRTAQLMAANARSQR